MSSSKALIGGVCFDAYRLDEAVDAVGDLINAQGRSLVVTPNLQHLRELRGSPGLKAAIDSADMVVADGAPIVWLSRLSDSRLPERVTGIDLFTTLCERPRPTPLRVFLWGGREASSLETMRRLQDLGVLVAGRNTEVMPLDRMPESAIRQIEASRPDVVAVFLGAPKQELLVQSYWAHLPNSVYMCLGGTVDFIAGAQPRAPLLFQRIGLEWAFRLMHDPRRLFRRYWWNGVHLVRLTWEATRDWDRRRRLERVDRQ